MAEVSAWLYIQTAACCRLHQFLAPSHCQHARSHPFGLGVERLLQGVGVWEEMLDLIEPLLPPSAGSALKERMVLWLRHWLVPQKLTVHFPALPHTFCGTLGQSLNLYVPQLPAYKLGIIILHFFVFLAINTAGQGLSPIMSLFGA